MNYYNINKYLSTLTRKMKAYFVFFWLSVLHVYLIHLCVPID